MRQKGDKGDRGIPGLKGNEAMTDTWLHGQDKIELYDNNYY